MMATVTRRVDTQKLTKANTSLGEWVVCSQMLMSLLMKIILITPVRKLIYK